MDFGAGKIQLTDFRKDPDRLQQRIGNAAERKVDLDDCSCFVGLEFSAGPTKRFDDFFF